MKISKIMTRHVRMLDPEPSIRDAASLMAAIDSGALLINEGDRLVGIVTVSYTHLAGADRGTPYRASAASAARKPR